MTGMLGRELSGRLLALLARSHCWLKLRFWKPCRAALKSDTGRPRALACLNLAACTALESPAGSWDCMRTKGEAWLGWLAEPASSSCSASISSWLPMTFASLLPGC